jgi:NADH-quinone oxidoreductase subunit N
MTITDLLILLPFIVMTAAIVVLLLVIAFYRDHKVSAILTLVSLAITFATLFFTSTNNPHPVTSLFIFDMRAYYFMGLILAASFVVTALSYEYLQKHQTNREEYYLLLLLATLGAMALAVSNHFASFFLGLEILSVSLYAMIAYFRFNPANIEAGIKYLVLAATSAAFLLFGMALIYAEVGSMEFVNINQALQAPGLINQVLLLVGFGLLLIGIGFKLALVPFHMWTADVYQGAPAPVTAFVATISKGSVFALLLRLFSGINLNNEHGLFLALASIAILSMVIGNLLGLLQKNVKRILAYSSIAHLGYLLVAFLASGTLALAASVFYLTAYFITTLGAFGILSVLSTQERDADSLDDYRGLFWSHPWLAATFSAMLFSLAGIPLTAGFVGKFFLVAAGIGSALWFLVITLIISSTIGLFYYLRIIVVLYQPAAHPSEAANAGKPVISLSNSLVLAALTLLLFWLGVNPTPLIHLIETTIIPLI